MLGWIQPYRKLQCGPLTFVFYAMFYLATAFHFMGDLCSQVCWRSTWGPAHCVSQYPTEWTPVQYQSDRIKCLFSKAFFPVKYWLAPSSQILFSSFWLPAGLRPSNKFIKTFIQLKLVIKCLLILGTIFKAGGGSGEQTQQDLCSPEAGIWIEEEK